MRNCIAPDPGIVSKLHKPVDTLSSPGLFHSSTLQKKVLTGGHQGT